MFIFLNYSKNKTIVKTSNLGGTFGRGVYANIPIKKGDLIEEGYLLLYVGENPLKCGIYKHYVYSLTDRPGVGFHLGTGGLYNHSQIIQMHILLQRMINLKYLPKKI